MFREKRKRRRLFWLWWRWERNPLRKPLQNSTVLLYTQRGLRGNAPTPSGIRQVCQPKVNAGRESRALRERLNGVQRRSAYSCTPSIRRSARQAAEIQPETWACELSTTSSRLRPSQRTQIGHRYPSFLFARGGPLSRSAVCRKTQRVPAS